MNTNLLIAAFLIPAFASVGVCDHKKGTQAESASTIDLKSATMASEKLTHFGKLVKEKGLNEVLKEMRGDSNSPELNSNDQAAVQSLAMGNNPVQIVHNGCYKVSKDPSQRDSNVTQEPWFSEIKTALHNSTDGQITITHKCSVPNPADKDGPMIEANRTFVAWGSKALDLNSQEHKVIAFVEVTV